MRNIWSIARRELAAFFHSSIAYIFIGAFLAISLFVVFWVDTFFARNLADIRPLFQWMPLLLIFLVAAITMRMWSEERHAGTLEALLTSPASLWQLVLGKFLGCFLLVAVALLLTLGLPITVSLIGPLDWGPVIGGYVAALLLASTYIAVGLYVSAKTDNQIVSLIVSVLVCLVLYLPGSELLTGFFSGGVSHWLNLISTDYRFDSITRGVLDIRDLYYYASLAAAFLVLNGLALTRLRWEGSKTAHKAHRPVVWAGGLVIANLLVANFWLGGLNQARVDLTQGNQFTLSAATTSELHRLSEPLLIEGIFSHKTHPLLAPLVPQLKNLMREYAISGGDQVTVRFVDPQSSTDVANKLAKRYGIKPVPFRNRSRYEASVVNAYFNVLIKYGDQYKVLSFQQLVEATQDAGGKIAVNLKAPEYVLTNTIKSVVADYRKQGDVFVSLNKPVTLHGYISANDTLPPVLAGLHKTFKSELADLQTQSQGMLKVDIQNPLANDGALADKIAKQYGFQPMVAGLLDVQPFYFYFMLQRGEQTVPISLPSDLTADNLKKAIVDGLSQFVSGTRKTVAIFAPQQNPMLARMGRASGPSFSRLTNALRGHVVVKQTDLSDGQVPAGTQLLLVLAPDQVKPKQLFAIDQFLMQGGNVVIAASPYQVKLGKNGLHLNQHKTGLDKWLGQKGISLGQTLVMDPRNMLFPVPVYRHIGGLTLQQYYPMPYPYFPFINGDGLNAQSPVTRSLQQMTLSWVSPIKLDHTKLDGNRAVPLLTSSPRSWLNDSTQVLPEQDAKGEPVPFAPSGKQASHVLAVAVTGQFTSWFANHPNPMLPQADKQQSDDKKADKPVITSVIQHSPQGTHLVVIGSSSFVADNTLGMIGAGLGRPYDQPIQLVQNLVDWTLQSPAMLALRDKASHSHLLQPLSRSEQMFWEYLNYALALLGLLLVAFLAWQRRGYRRRQLIRQLNDAKNTAGGTK